MNLSKVSRRNMLLGTGASLASMAVGATAQAPAAKQPGEQDPQPLAPTPDQIRRLKWWHEAKFGMFIHFGAYSEYGRHEWAMETQAIPLAEYKQFAKEFHPKPGF